MLWRLGLGYFTGAPIFMIRRRGHRCRRLFCAGFSVSTGARCASEGNLYWLDQDWAVVNDAGEMH